MDKIVLPLNKNHNIQEFIRFNLASRVAENKCFYKYKIIKNQLEVELLEKEDILKKHKSYLIYSSLKVPQLLVLVALLITNTYILSLNTLLSLQDNHLKIKKLNLLYKLQKSAVDYKLNNLPKYDILRLLNKLPIKIKDIYINDQQFSASGIFNQDTLENIAYILRNSKYNVNCIIKNECNNLTLVIEGKP